MAVQPDDIARAASTIAGLVHHTPVLSSHLLDAWIGSTVFCKAEHLQRVGAFKYRGATNAVMGIDSGSLQFGVAAHSSGNHAAALAKAAQQRGVAAHLVMPSNAPAVKRAAAEAYGATITECEPSESARIAMLEAVCARTGAMEIHPFDNDDIIAGAGTAALELLDQVDRLDAIIVPVGGGGLLSGTCLAAKLAASHVAVYGAEPAGADDAAQSIDADKLIPQTQPNTICDGLLTSLAPRTFDIIRHNVTAIVTVEDEATRDAMLFAWTRMKQLIEPSSAIALAAARALPELRGLRVGVVLSGGNVDPGRFAALVQPHPN